MDYRIVNAKPKNTQLLQEIADARSGKFLSGKFIDSKTKLKFQCNQGHIFEAKPSSVMRGSWCKLCTKSISENICNYIFVKLFEVPFRSTYLKMFGHCLELDGFNEDLKIAFEYNGYQHYKKNRFVNNDKDLEYRKHLDELKVKYCKLNNITLIVIPYTIKHIDIVDFIKHELVINGITFVDKDIKIIDFINNYSYTKDKIDKVTKYIKSKNGKLLDCGTDFALVECDKGHQWKFNMYMLYLKTWCKKCFHINAKGKLHNNNNLPVTIDYVQEICNKNNIECLSDKLDNKLKSTVSIKCGRNHISKHILERLLLNINQKRKICKHCLDDDQYDYINKLKTNGLILVDYDDYKNKYTCTKWICTNNHISIDTAKNIAQRIVSNSKICKFCDK